MCSVLDVARYIVQKRPPMTTMKLQKLVYYSYAEYARATGEPMFAEVFEAWVNGPVCRELFDFHRHEMVARRSLFSGAYTLDDEQIAAIDKTLEQLGDYEAADLSEKTHSESPWKKARRDALPWEYTDSPITFESVKEWARTGV